MLRFGRNIDFGEKDKKREDKTAEEGESGLQKKVQRRDTEERWSLLEERQEKIQTRFTRNAKTSAEMILTVF